MRVMFGFVADSLKLRLGVRPWDIRYPWFDLVASGAKI